jgi:uncharacterized protein (UPF0276 family)
LSALIKKLNMKLSEIPVLGIGMASDVSAVQPDFRKFIDQEPEISYLNFGAHYSQFERIKYYIQDLIDRGFPLVFHPINFNISINSKEDQYVLDAINRIVEYTKPKWMGQDIGIWVYGKQYLGSYLIPPILDMISINEVCKKYKYLSQNVNCPILLENPPVYFSVEKMSMNTFFRKIVDKINCGIILDIGHLIGYNQATGRDYKNIDITDFPFENVIEIHLAGLQYSQIGEDLNIIDQHAYPIDDLCWDFLEMHIHKMTNLKAITLEQEFCSNEVAFNNLEKAKFLFKPYFLNYA